MNEAGPEPLDAAVADERSGRYIESLRRCLTILSGEPHNVGALALASRLSLLAGDAANALAYANEALRLDASDDAARSASNAAQTFGTQAAQANELYSRAIEAEPGVAEHLAIPGSLSPFDAMTNVQALLEQSIALDPGLARAHASIGNLCVRRNEYLAAAAAYQRALYLDGDPEYALALSEIYFTLGEASAADAFRRRAFAQKQLFESRPTPKTQARILALMTPGPWPLNTPLDFAVDRSRIRVDRLYLTGQDIPIEQFAGYDSIYNAIGEAEAAQPAIRQAIRHAELVQASPSLPRRRMLNNPANSWKTSRPALGQALQAVDGCAVPAAARVARSALEKWDAYPSLARPVDSHGGKGLTLLQSTEDLARFLQTRPEPQFDVTPYVEYRSADGYYRKYRIAVVDGTPYPYHLAISPNWLVHYIGSPTADTAWMQAEEERFLENPRGAFPSWPAPFDDISRILGLDYFAIDCSLLDDGRVLVFEADIASLIHCREPAGSYKYRYVPRIFEALERLLTERSTPTNARTPSG